MFWKEHRTNVVDHAASDRIPVRLVTDLLEHGVGTTSTVDLVEALNAARYLVDTSGRADRERWFEAVDQINIWLAVRCLCGDPIAITFINDRDVRVSTWTAA